MEQPNGKREWLAITPAEYHALDAWGSGALRAFIKDGPLEFWDAYVAKTTEREESDAQTLGSDFHLGIQYEDFAERFRLLPERIIDDDCMHAVNGLLKGNAKRLEAGQPIDTNYVAHSRYLEAHRQLAANDGVQCIDGRVSGMIASCWDNLAVAELLSDQSAEHEAACISEHKGLKLKSLLDLKLSTSAWDFKSTCRRNNDAFLRDAFNRGYQYQAGLYCLVTGYRDFGFISVRSAPSYEANAFRVPREELKRWIDETEEHVDRLAGFFQMRPLEGRDSQGVPPSFHNEGWGTVLSFSQHGPFNGEQNAAA